MNKTMSLKQLAANRQNALKSTGPTTPQGRAISKMNAFKHGLMSREVLVRGINRRESGRDLEALYQRFWDDLKPAGPVEEMLVDQIVTAQWRLRRALTAEAGEILLQVDDEEWPRGRPYMARQWASWEAKGDPVLRMEESALGNRLLRQWLEEVRALVEQEGELTEVAIQKIVRQFGGKPNRLTRELERLQAISLKNPEGLEAAALRERNKIEALTFLIRELNHVEGQENECEEWDRHTEAAQQAAAALPDAEFLDKILRYETKLERQIYRALAQLERLQRIRLGEVVPPPLSVEVSEGT